MALVGGLSPCPNIFIVSSFMKLTSQRIEEVWIISVTALVEIGDGRLVETLS